MPLVEIKLQPFAIPDFVQEERQGLAIESQTHRLEDLPLDTLRELCNEFVVAVFEKADKSLNDEPATEFQKLMTAIEKNAYEAALILYEDGVRAGDV